MHNKETTMKATEITESDRDIINRAQLVIARLGDSVADTCLVCGRQRETPSSVGLAALRILHEPLRRK